MVALPRLLVVCCVLVAAVGARASDAAQAKSEILQADSDFCARAQKDGVVAASRFYAAPDATFLDTQPGVLRGPDAAALHLGGLPPGAVLQWKPVFADASASGDFGYTWGTYALSIPGPDGVPKAHSGHYCTIWKRQPDGSWKLVLDLGEADPAAPKKHG